MASNLPGRTELIDGVVYEVSPQNPAHANAIDVLNKTLSRALDLDIYSVRTETPIAVAGWRGPHAPEIDVVVIHAREWYENTPEAADTLVAIEVSDTTYRDDRDVKIPLYQSAGIEAWILNIPKRQVESFDNTPRIYHDGETFEIHGVSIPVSKLFRPLIL